MSKPQDIKPASRLGQLMAAYARQEIKDDLDGWAAIQARLNPVSSSLNGANPPTLETSARRLAGWRKWLVWELAATVVLAVAVLAIVVVLQSQQPSASTTQVGRVVPTQTPGTVTPAVPTTVASPTALPTTLAAPPTTTSAPATVTSPTNTLPNSNTFCTDFAYPGATRLTVSQALFMGDEPEHVPTPTPQTKYGAFASAAAYSDISSFYLQSIRDCGYVSNNNPQINHQDDTLTMFSGNKGSHQLTLSVFSPKWLAFGGSLPTHFSEVVSQFPKGQTLVIFYLT